MRTSRAANADDGALRDAALLLAGLTVAAAGVTYGAARLTAGRILRPIAELTAAAEHVTRTRDLTARLGSAGTSDEVGRLGSSFDTMLAALHESVTAQRQLVADASHELRTPLTSLTTNLDLLEDGAGLADPQAPALVRAAREQAGELDQLITDLLDLARYRESTPHRETVRLDLLTDEAVRRLRQRGPHPAIAPELRSVPGARRPCRCRSRRQQPGRQRPQMDAARRRGARGRRGRPGVGHRSRPGHRRRGPPPHLRTLLPGTRRTRHARRRARTSHRRRRRAARTTAPSRYRRDRTDRPSRWRFRRSRAPSRSRPASRSKHATATLGRGPATSCAVRVRSRSWKRDDRRRGGRRPVSGAATTARRGSAGGPAMRRSGCGAVSFRIRAQHACSSGRSHETRPGGAGEITVRSI